MKSRNLNFLEPSGPLQACNGTALHYKARVYVVLFRTLAYVCKLKLLYIFKFIKIWAGGTIRRIERALKKYFKLNQQIPFYFCGLITGMSRIFICWHWTPLHYSYKETEKKRTLIEILKSGFKLGYPPKTKWQQCWRLVIDWTAYSKHVTIIRSLQFYVTRYIFVVCL